jgi:Flp pilus assembly pilin Flp
MSRISRDERGQTMAEFALLLAVIALIVIVAAVALGGGISATLNTATGYV